MSEERDKIRDMQNEYKGLSRSLYKSVLYLRIEYAMNVYDMKNKIR